MGLVLQLCSYGRVRCFFHVGSQAHPLDGEGHGLRTEESAVNVLHLLNCPPMRVLKGWLTIFIEVGHVAQLDVADGDGKQRLASLDAVMRTTPVLRLNVELCESISKILKGLNGWRRKTAFLKVNCVLTTFFLVHWITEYDVR